MKRRAFACTFAALAVLWLPGGSLSAWPQDVTPDVQLSEARRHFDAAAYQKALANLDVLVPALEARTSSDASASALLASAYELRARTRLALGRADGARADFRSLLAVAPGHTLTGKVSNRVSALFEDVRKETVGSVVLRVSPADAELTLDGRPFVVPAGPLFMLAGPHALAGRRSGFGSASVPFTVTPGSDVEVALVLERVAATVALVTSPPGVEVVVDGIPRGETEPGPPAPPFDRAAETLAVSPESVSRPFVIDDLPEGTHAFEFRRGCHVKAERRLEVQTLADFVLEPVKLEKAVASVVADAPAGATVLLDGKPRAASPAAIDDVCEGAHIVEMRAPWGRYVERITARTGEKHVVRGALRPAVALLGPTSVSDARPTSDVRRAVEQALAGSKNILLFAPPGGEVDQALTRESLSPGWLAFDPWRRPIAPEAAAVTPGARVEVSQRLSQAFEAQGVAALTPRPGGSADEWLLSVLAAGSAEPDVFEVTIGGGATAGAAVSRLDMELPLERPSAGLTVVDVLDVPGAVVVSVDPRGGAARAGIVAGDIITRAGGRTVADAATFASVLAEPRAASLAAEVKDRAGTLRNVELALAMTPRVIAMSDESWPFNSLIIALRARLARAAQGGLAESAARLNLAVALMRVGNWVEALSELGQVRLPEGPGVSSGTVSYLSGLCYEAMDEPGEAAKAWQAAAADSGSLLTEDGPPVKELAERRLKAAGGRLEGARGGEVKGRPLATAVPPCYIRQVLRH